MARIVQSIPVIIVQMRHTIGWCVGGAPLYSEESGIIRKGSRLYLVADSGVESEANHDWWCEECCRERGWIW